MQQWIANDMLQFQSESAPGTGALHCLVITLSGQSVVLKHKRCQQPDCWDGLCGDCRSLTSNKTMLEAIATWCRRLDQATLLYLSVYERTKVGPFLEEMLSAPYARFSSKCKKEVERCVELLNTLSIDSLHDRCLRQWICHPHHMLTQKIRNFMSRHVNGLTLLDTNDAEQEAYESLCQRLGHVLESGETAHEDLQIASWVATGQLQKHRAVHALVKTFIHAERKIERGCLSRPGKSLDPEVRMELMSTLGRSSEALDMLQMFHVNTKGGHPAIDFTDPLVPKFFMTNLSPSTMQESCSMLRGILGSTGERRLLALSIDETYWRVGWEAVSRLQGDKGEALSIVGGGFSLDNNCTVLSKQEPREECNLSRLSVSVIVSRHDCNHLTFDCCFVPLLPGEGKGSLFMTLVGKVMQSFIQTGSGIPPLSISFDNGLSNRLLNLGLLGLLDSEELAQHPFLMAAKRGPRPRSSCFPLRACATEASGS